MFSRKFDWNWTYIEQFVFCSKFSDNNDNDMKTLWQKTRTFVFSWITKRQKKQKLFHTWNWESKMCVCVCVCVCERERERACDTRGSWATFGFFLRKGSKSSREVLGQQSENILTYTFDRCDVTRSDFATSFSNAHYPKLQYSQTWTNDHLWIATTFEFVVPFWTFIT